VRESSGKVCAVIVRRQEAITGAVEVEVNQVAATIFKVTVRVRNLTRVTAGELQSSDAVQMPHVRFHAPRVANSDAEFISLLEPPAEYEPLVAACKNIGAWPVLVGDAARGERGYHARFTHHLYDYRRSRRRAGAIFATAPRLMKCSPSGFDDDRR